MIKKLLVLVLLYYCSSNIFAGTTGKLSGTVKEAETGEPIPGVNIIIEGTTFGAATNIDGFYSINNLPPGSYTINVSAVGYQRKQFVGVKISADFTTELDAELSTESVELQTIVVQAQAPMIRKDLTSSHTTIDAGQIESLPVESVSDLLTLQAGINQDESGRIHIRGGRSTEVAYTVNGVSINNPYDNSRSVVIATNAIQELSVVSGTFNAEYGNALSGIVNTVTKEGGSDYSGKISFYTGDNLSSRKSTFFNIDAVDPLNNYVVEGTLSGPVPFTKNAISFFFSGRYDDDKGWLYGQRQHLPGDYVFKNPEDPNDIRLVQNNFWNPAWDSATTAAMRDNAIVSMNPATEFSGTAKFTFRPTSTIKINYDALYSNSEYKGYSHDYKYNPDASYNNHEWGLLNALEMRHAVSNTTFYSLRGSYNINDFSQYLYPLLDSDGNPVDYYAGMGVEGLHADPRYMRTDRIYQAANYTFVSGGTRNNHSYQRSKTLGIKFDITSQISSTHEVKAGAEYNKHTLDYENFFVLRDGTHLQPTIDSIGGPNHDLYTKEPTVISGYIQDKMEFDKLILNAGIRYDYFDANSQYSTNIFYPTPNHPNLPVTVDKNSLLANAKPKHQISPRIGISFPITDQGIIHFSYGHFFQMPPFRYLYSNPNFEYSFTASTIEFGNANLKPEKTVSYELGLQQQLFEDLAFNITGFYKDVRDLLAYQQIRISGSETYYTYVNKDYANIKGLIFSLTKRRTAQDMLGVTLDYTFQVSEGNDVDNDAFFLDLSSGRQTEKVPVYLGWDQTHIINATVSIGQPNDWNVSVIGKFGTGLPYTPQILQSQVYLRPNSGRKPTQTNVDLLAEKTFSVYGSSITFFLKVFNLFDTLNERLVYNDTGRSTYTLQTELGSAKATNIIAENVPGVHSSEEYFNIPSYYSSPREVRLGASIEF